MTTPKLQYKSFLRWAGSKRQQIPALSEYWSNDFKRYIEPFAGSACFFFSLEPKKAVLNDINNELILTYKMVRDRTQDVHQLLNEFEISKNEFYKLRSLEVDKLSDIKRAARFIYLNRFCFNGLYRTNLKGQFNVPYGGLKSGKLPTLHKLEICSKILKGAKLYNFDFEKILNKAKKGDFVYIDPPYSIKSIRTFKQYNPTVFGLSDLKRLKVLLDKMDSDGVKFVLSYANSPEINLLKSDYKINYITVRRNIAGFSSKRKRAKEVHITNI